MNEKKKLRIEAMQCDLRNVSEEVLAQYDSITIEAMVIYVTEASLALLHKHHAAMDAMLIEKVDAGSNFVEKNGSFVIRPGQAGEPKTQLLVNGSLKIEKGANKVLQNYSKITVNGTALYPQSAVEILSSILNVNGKETVYPDGENDILLEKNSEIDRIFLARAKENAHYFSERRLIFADEKADYERLAAKNITFEAPKAIMTEAALEQAAACLEDSVKIELIPEGCTFTESACQLDDSFVCQYGTRVYVNGSLTVSDAEALAQMEFIRVAGTASVREDLKKAFLQICKDCGSLNIYRGTLLSDQQELIIDSALLSAHPEGISVTDCVNLILADDLDSALVQERLRISDCVRVSCPASLHSVIRSITKDCQHIDLSESDQQEDPDENTLCIEAMSYRM